MHVRAGEESNSCNWVSSHSTTSWALNCQDSEDFCDSLSADDLNRAGQAFDGYIFPGIHMPYILRQTHNTMLNLDTRPSLANSERDACARKRLVE